MVTVHPTLQELAAAIRRLEPSTEAYDTPNRVWIKEGSSCRNLTKPAARAYLARLLSGPRCAAN